MQSLTYLVQGDHCVYVAQNTTRSCDGGGWENTHNFLEKPYPLKQVDNANAFTILVFNIRLQII